MPHIRRALSKYSLPAALGALLVPAIGAGAPTPATFAAATAYPLPWNPGSMFGVADFNGDGTLDVAVSSEGLNPNNEFGLFPGNGDGTLGSPTYISVLDPLVNVSLPNNPTVGDLNNDGKPDLVWSGYGDNSNDIALNQSSGGVFNFTSPTAVSLVGAPQAPAMTAVGDLNGDGKADLVQTGYNGGQCGSGALDGNSILMRLGNGDGTFGAQQQVFTSPNPLACGGSMGAAIADVNADGRPDIIGLSNQVSPTDNHGSILVGLGDGMGAVQQPAPRVLTGSDGRPWQIAVADLNGDSRPDVVTANDTSTSVLLGNGDGTFQTPQVDASLPASGLAVGDVNGDGVKDIVVSTYAHDDVRVALGNGDGTFDAPSQIAFPAGTHPWGLALADLNGDGLNDIIEGSYIYGSASNTMSVLLNNTPPPAPGPTPGPPAPEPNPAPPSPEPGPAPQPPVPVQPPSPSRIVAPGVTVGEVANTANVSPSAPASASDLLKAAQVTLPRGATVIFVEKWLPKGLRLVDGKLVGTAPGVYVVRVQVKRKNGKITSRRIKIRVG